MNYSRKLSLVVIPVINEYKNLSILLPRILNNQLDVDVLVIDDASTDSTHLLIQELERNFKSRMLYILNQKSSGIGGAHLQGLIYAREHNYEFVVTMDGDLTHDSLDIGRLIQKITDDDTLELVIGSRFLPDSSIEGWTLSRIVLTHLGHLFTLIILQMSEDLSSGLRVYRVLAIPDAVLSFRNQIGFEYFALSAYAYKLESKRISEIGVILSSRGEGKSKLTFRKALKSIFSTLHLRFYAKRILKI